MAPPPVTVIEPPRGWAKLGLSEVWKHRELLLFFVWRDIKVRYKQTLVGSGWALLQPLLTMVIFTIFFGRLAKVPSDGVPYPLFALCGLLPWQLFAFAITEGGNSLVSQQQLIKKVYFPRLIVPLASVLAGLVDFCIAFLLLVAAMLYYGVALRPTILLLPVFVLFVLATALAISFWLSALNVEYRDVRYTIPFLTQLWMFATPVAYPASLVPQKWRALYGLNPMAGVVEGFRWALLGSSPPEIGPMVGVSVLVVLFGLAGGLVYFRRMETTFADVV
jgi:lipopolysaccharide transport system permease protein